MASVGVIRGEGGICSMLLRSAMVWWDQGGLQGLQGVWWGGPRAIFGPGIPQ